MADEVDREREDGRRLRVLTGGRDEGDPGRAGGRDREADLREPGREAAGQDRRAGELAADAAGIGPAGQGTEADRLEQNARLEQVRRDGARADERPGALAADDQRVLRERAADLRSRAGADRSVVRGEDDQRLAYQADAADHDGPERSADLARADWLGADADRRERSARADEAQADSLDAEADAGPARVQEPTRDRLSPTDGTQPGAHHAATPPTRRPTARKAGRAAGHVPTRDRERR